MSSTWFKEHSLVFTDDAQLGDRHIMVLEEDKSEFLHKVYRPYLSVIDHINVRMESTELVSAMSVFDPRHLPCTEEELSDYGMEQIKILTDFIVLNGSMSMKPYHSRFCILKIEYIKILNSFPPSLTS